MALTKLVDTFRVDAIDSGPFDTHVHVQALTDGGFVYAWRERDVDGYNERDRIHVRKFDADGNPVGSEVEIPGAIHEPGPHGSGSGHDFPSIAPLAGGGFAVEYNDWGMGTDYTNGTHYSNQWTWVATFNSSGVLVSQAAPLSQPVQGSANSFTNWSSVVSSDGSGGYHSAVIQIVSYAEGPSGNRIVLDGFEVLRHQGLLSSATEGYSIGSGAIEVADHADGAIAVYMRNYYNSSVERSDLWAVTSTGFEFRINDLIDGNQSIASEGDYLAQLSNGNYVLVWKDSNTTTDEGTDPGLGVHARIFRGDGTFVTGDIVLSATPGGDETAPAVAAMGGGRWIAVWEDDGGIVAQVFSATGARLGNQVATGIPASGDSITLTVLTDDRIVFAFHDGGSTTSSQIWRFPDIFGTSADDTLSGTINSDVIHGYGGNDWLDGGDGADTLIGYNGNDTFVVDNAGDTVTEYFGQGIDTVRTTLASYSLGGGVENLVGLLAGGQTLNGNQFDNAITGAAGNDTLNGYSGNDTLDGGFEADTMYGNLGDDIFYVDNAGDIVREYANQGTDTVRTTLTSYSLGGALENLEGLLGTGQTLIGNQFANAITGGEGGDTLKGYSGNDTLNGGVGADTMYGNLGDDTYFVDNASDVVTEYTNEGIDTVRTTLSSYTLGAHLENLAGLSASGQTLKGNNLNNTISGGAGDDRINGSLGADTLSGGAGADTFVFAYYPGSTYPYGVANNDLILDFVSGQDRMELTSSAFPGLSAGDLPESALYAGAAAHDGDDRIIYDAATGKLWFDPDGTGGQAAMLFATLGETSHPATIAVSDFVVV